MAAGRVGGLERFDESQIGDQCPNCTYASGQNCSLRELMVG